MGGGSADAAFTFTALARADRGDVWVRENRDVIASALLTLGADCPFFAYNRPMYAEGIGEELEEVRWISRGCGCWPLSRIFTSLPERPLPAWCRVSMVLT